MGPRVANRHSQTHGETPPDELPAHTLHVDITSPNRRPNLALVPGSRLADPATIREEYNRKRRADRGRIKAELMNRSGFCAASFPT